MKNFSSILNQLLSHVPRGVFKNCVDRYKGDYRARKFKCWSQFAVMVYAQITSKVSLRDTVFGFANRENYFCHLGVENVVRSTLADANRKRDWHIYEDLFKQVLLRCRRYTQTQISL